MYGSSLRDSKQYDEAEEVYKKTVAIQPNNTDALISLAVLAHLKNKPAEADEYVSKALMASRESHILYADLAFGLLANGKFSESVKYYEKAIKLEPRGVDFYNLACAYALLKEKDKALGALEQSLKHGYGSKQQFEGDSDLESVRSDERFKKLFTEFK